MGGWLLLASAALVELGCNEDAGPAPPQAQAPDAGLDAAGGSGGDGASGSGAGGGQHDAGADSEPSCETSFSYEPPPLLDTSDHTSQSPLVDRAFEARTYAFNGSDYLLVNYGNDLKWFNIDDPRQPQPGAESHWMYNLVQPWGDVDFNLFGFSFCDDCRWGMANFRDRGSIVFDAGTQGGPGFGAAELHPNADTLGSFMFEKGGVQYLIVNEMDGTLPHAQATLYTIAGVAPADITKVTELTTASGAFGVRSGARYGDHLYLAPSGGLLPVGSEVVIVDITDPTNPVATASGIPCGQGYAPLSVDAEHGLLVATQALVGTQLLDLTADPAQPTLLANVPAAPGEQIASVEVSYPYLMVQNLNSLWMDVYDIADPANPVSIDSSFWNDGNLAHNDYGGGRTPYDAAFSPDNSAIYAARHVVLQVFAVDCN